MKNLKKALALLLIAAMAMSLLCVGVLADDTDTTPTAPAEETTTTAATGATYTIEIAADTGSGLTTGHEYSVYQLFVGDLSGGVLSNIKYGTAGVGAAGAAVPADTLAAITDAEAYADSLNIASLTKYDTLKEANSWKITGVPAGYYLIVDDTTKALADGDGYSSYIVQVVDNVKMAPKSDKVTSDKTEKNDDLEDVAYNEAGIGTAVSYTLTAKIADNAGEYDYYNFILKDTLSKGLTFNNDVTVTISDMTGAAVKDTDYALYTGDDAKPYTFKIALLNAKAHPGATVVVKYSATKNADAVTLVPEENTFRVTYSNNPEYKYEGEKDTSKPGLPLDDSKKVFGDTPEKKTYTYETELVLTKKDDAGNLLKGATFKLTSTNAIQPVLEEKEYYTLDPNGTYYLLNNGKYTETAPTGTEYVKIGTGDSKTTVGYLKKTVDGVDTYYVPTDVKEYIDQDLYMLVLGTDSQYASLNKYSKTKATTDISAPANVEVVLTTGENGVLNFNHLGSGTYTLKEVDAPDGYNYLESDVTFTINFDAENKTFTVSNVTGAEITNNSGKFATTVTDKKGSTLPETGGMGTKLFYIFGAILVLGAGVLLITKKRMAHE